MIIKPETLSFNENYKIMIGSIVPRPIAFVSTVSGKGINNLAPFSFFSGVCSNPPTIVFAPAIRTKDGLTKDTLNNIRETEEFIVNIVSREFAEKMTATARDFPPEVDEFVTAGLTPVMGQRVKVPRVKEAKISFECSLNQIVQIGDGSPGSGFLVIGTIILFHIEDGLMQDGRIDLTKLNPVGRTAGRNGYCLVNNQFEIS